MNFDLILQSFARLHGELGGVLDMGLLIFVRMLGFVVVGPIFNRKNLPFIVKVIMAMFLTAALIWLVPAPPKTLWTQQAGGFYLLQIMMNATIGMLIGFIANMILLTIYSAGNMVNNQIGLSGATLMDPSSGRQAMVLESLFAYIAITLFIYLGGVHWMILALKRSFELFPVAVIAQDVTAVIDLEYLVTVSGNTLLVAVQLVAPVIVVTMAVDIILGIVNRAAQQMPVFQLSFALKPAIGVAIMLVTMPIFLQAVADFLTDFASIF